MLASPAAVCPSSHPAPSPSRSRLSSSPSLPCLSPYLSSPRSGGDAGRREGGGGRQGGGAGEGRGGGGGREGGDGANLDGWIWSGEGDAAMGMEAGRWRSRWSPARRFRDGGRDGDVGGARASGFGRSASSRTRIDKTMMDELKEVKKAVNPTEILLVVDAMTGQEAAALVTTFNIEIGVTGAILTKLDGDSRGGAALSVKEVSGKPIKFVGRGERMEDLELFYPDQMAQRVLGMEDVLSFVEKAQEVMCQEDAVELQKIMSAKFDFNDFLKQTQNVAKMGSMSRVIGMIPGMNKVTPAQIREAKKRLALVESMINAMTAEERERPELLAESRERRMRMAEESGKTEQEVSQLVAQLFQMRAQMQKLMGMMQGQEAIPGMGDLMESIKADEKAPPGTARRKRRHGKPRQRELDAVGGVSRF